MSKQNSEELSKRQELIYEFLSELSDPIHKRVIQSYGGNEPVESMEAELWKIMLEILSDED